MDDSDAPHQTAFSLWSVSLGSGKVRTGVRKYSGLTSYHSSVWRVLWKPGVRVPWVCEAAALGCAWKGVESRWELGGRRHSPEVPARLSPQIAHSSFLLVCVAPTWTQSLPCHSGGGVPGGLWRWPDPCPEGRI